MAVKNHNFRFNEEKEEERKAWQILHSEEVKEDFRSQNEFVIAASDENVDGFSAVTVRGDMNLIPENIRKGTKSYGVYGDYYPTLIDDKVMKPLSIEPGRDGKVLFPKDYAADGFSFRR